MMRAIFRSPGWVALSIALSASVAGSSNRSTPAIRVEKPWIRLTPPSVTNGLAFVTLHNETDRALKLIGARCDMSKSVEFHLMSHDDDRMSMRRVPDLDIPARGSLDFGPGGAHLMLIDLLRPLSLDQIVHVTLEFEGGSELSLQFPVSVPPSP
jgi:copper(I)-binding protein